MSLPASNAYSQKSLEEWTGVILRIGPMKQVWARTSSFTTGGKKNISSELAEAVRCAKSLGYVVPLAHSPPLCQCVIEVVVSCKG
jgi:hypothetical protein